MAQEAIKNAFPKAKVNCVIGKESAPTEFQLPKLYKAREKKANRHESTNA